MYKIQQCRILSLDTKTLYQLVIINWKGLGQQKQYMNIKEQSTTHTTRTNTQSKPLSASHSQQLDLLMFYQTEPSDLFPEPEEYPPFFHQNLTNPNRVIKLPSLSPHNNIQVFYYQLLLMGFQLNDMDGSRAKIIEKFKELVLSPEFDILFTRDTQEYRQIFNNEQFKKLLGQFFILLEAAVEPVETILNRLPIIDTIMIHVIRSFLFYLGVNEEFEKEIPTEVVFIQLAEQIGLRLTCYSFDRGVCWRFEDSDMFCLDEGEGKLYLAYIPLECRGSEPTGAIETQGVGECREQQMPIGNHNSVSSSLQQIDNSIESQQIYGMGEKHGSVNEAIDVEGNRFNVSNSESLNLGSETFLHIINNFDNCRLTEYAIAEASNSDVVIRNVEYDSQNVVAFEPTNDTTIKFEPNSGLLFSFSRLPEQEDLIIEPSNSISPYTSNLHLNSPIFPNLTQTDSKLNSYGNTSSNPEESIRWNFKKSKGSTSKLNTSVEFQEWKPSVGYDREKVVCEIMTDYKDKSISDYYNDFTSSFTLSAISEPYRSQVKNIKTRVKGPRRY